MNHYLIQLDKLNLIELHPQNRFKILIKGEPIWEKNGHLAKAFKQEIIQDFDMKKPAICDHFFLHDYSEQDFKQISDKLEDLINTISLANNRAPKTNLKIKSYGFNITLKEFKWSLDKYL